MDELMNLKHLYPADEASWQSLPPTKVDQRVIDRHHKVAEIVNRHLKEIEAEVGRLNPAPSIMIDVAGDRAEIARQALTLLVDQLRGVGSGRRTRLEDAA
jgi:hypothetical protein